MCKRKSNRLKTDLVMPGYNVNQDVNIGIACVVEMLEPGYRGSDLM